MQTLRPNTKIQIYDPDLKCWKMWDAFPGRYSDGAPDEEHFDVLVTSLREKGPAFWNDWRAAHPSVQPNLTRVEFEVVMTQGGVKGANLAGYDLSEAILNQCSLAAANVDGTNLRGAKLRESLINGSSIRNADFTGADLTQASMLSLKCIESNFSSADLTRVLMYDSTMFSCNFDKADLESAELESALFNGSSFRKARLWNTRWDMSDLTHCVLNGADLTGAHLIRTKLYDADLTGARVYAVNCWDIGISDKTIQQDLIVSSPKEPAIRVDDIRIAQFVHFILTNENLGRILNTVTKKGVLILGRFGGGGLEVLQAVGERLRKYGYIPMIFDFERPQNKTYTETVQTLAGLARFVIVDLSGPSVPQELYATVPHLKIPFIPILEKDLQPYSLFVDLLENEWVLNPIVDFESLDDLLLGLHDKIINPAEKRIAMREEKLKKLLGE